MIKAIIFDFDGVIVESVDIKTKSFGKLFEPYGKEVAKRVIDYHLKNTGVSRFDKFKYIFKNILNRKLTKSKFNDFCKKFSQQVVNEVLKAPYVRGSKEFLDKYINEYQFFVSSATPQVELEFIIKRRGLLCYFEQIYGSPNKKRDIVKKIILNKRLLPKEVVYIGDSLSDYKAAKFNSVNFIARVDNNGQIFDNLSDCVKINDLRNLRKALKAI